MYNRFIEWVLSKAKITNDAAGDLIADLQRDQNLQSVLKTMTLHKNLRHHKIQTRGQLKDYLESRNACEGAIDAADKVWDRFLHWRRQQKQEAAIEDLRA